MQPIFLVTGFIHICMDCVLSRLYNLQLWSPKAALLLQIIKMDSLGYSEALMRLTQHASGPENYSVSSWLVQALHCRAVMRISSAHVGRTFGLTSSPEWPLAKIIAAREAKKNCSK